MLAAYSAAKAGVAGLIRSLGAELGGTGITANAVSPGSTDTPILAETARLYGLSAGQSFAGQQPMGRLLDPEEVAAALVWLAGEESSAMTGAVVAVDGGLALVHPLTFLPCHWGHVCEPPALRASPAPGQVASQGSRPQRDARPGRG